MAQTAETFRKNAIESRLLTAEEIDYALADLPPSQFPDTGEKLARELIKRKLLTSFQAHEIYSGRLKTLVLGNYVVIEKLGQGGMGLVLKARHRLMKRLAAIKILPAAAAKDAEAIARFQREFFAAGQLQHANIVTAYDADESRGVHYLAMEFVDGKDLGSFVKATGPMDASLAIKCIMQAAKGLEYAHRQGVIHRDIKPQNLLIDGEGNVKVLDMGLARFEALAGAPSTELTSTGAIMGTVDYMAPEQAMNTKDADGQSDIYSLGATLWFLMTGQPMYKGDSLMARLLAHRDAPIPSLAAACPNSPRALPAIFEQMVAKTPATRFASMTQVIAALEPLAGVAISEESGLSVADTFYRDPRLLAFFENLEADKQTKVFAPPQIGKLEVSEQTLAIAGRVTDTKKVVAAAKDPLGSGSKLKRSAWPEGNMLPIILSGVVGVLGIGLLVAIILLFAAPKAGSVDQKNPAEAKSNIASSTPEESPFKENLKRQNTPKEQPSPSPEHVTAAPSTAITTESTSTIDLIALANPKRGFKLPSDWEHDGLELKSRARSGVENLKIAPVTIDRYRVDCEFTCSAQGDAFYIVLPLGDAQIEWGVNAYTKPNVDASRRGFASIGSRDLRNSPGSREVPRLIVGARHKVSIEVDVKGDNLRLKESFDDESPMEWTGEKSEVTLPDTYLWPERNMIGCGVVNSQYQVHRFTLTPLEK